MMSPLGSADGFQGGRGLARIQVVKGGVPLQQPRMARMLHDLSGAHRATHPAVCARNDRGNGCTTRVAPAAARGWRRIMC
jgi:hypothetical protein